MKLWLNDVRDPEIFGLVDWTWVKTYEDAIEALKSGQVECASLDHDLGGWPIIGGILGEKTGYDLVCWMEEQNVWPLGGTVVHSQNPIGADRMRQVIERHYRRTAMKRLKCPCPARCNYCGARRRRDSVGRYCPTRNCRWQHGYVGCTLHQKEDTTVQPPPSERQGLVSF